MAGPAARGAPPPGAPTDDDVMLLTLRNAVKTAGRLDAVERRAYIHEALFAKHAQAGGGVDAPVVAAAVRPQTSAGKGVSASASRPKTRRGVRKEQQRVTVAERALHVAPVPHHHHHHHPTGHTTLSPRPVSRRGRIGPNAPPQRSDSPLPEPPTDLSDDEAEARGAADASRSGTSAEAVAPLLRCSVDFPDDFEEPPDSHPGLGVAGPSTIAAEDHPHTTAAAGTPAAGAPRTGTAEGHDTFLCATMVLVEQVEHPDDRRVLHLFLQSLLQARAGAEAGGGTHSGAQVSAATPGATVVAAGGTPAAAPIAASGLVGPAITRGGSSAGLPPPGPTTAHPRAKVRHLDPSSLSRASISSVNTHGHGDAGGGGVGVWGVFMGDSPNKVFQPIPCTLSPASTTPSDSSVDDPAAEAPPASGVKVSDAESSSVDEGRFEAHLAAHISDVTPTARGVGGAGAGARPGRGRDAPAAAIAGRGDGGSVTAPDGVRSPTPPEPEPSYFERAQIDALVSDVRELVAEKLRTMIPARSDNSAGGADVARSSTTAAVVSGVEGAVRRYEGADIAFNKDSVIHNVCAVVRDSTSAAPSVPPEATCRSDV